MMQCLPCLLNSSANPIAPLKRRVELYAKEQQQQQNSMELFEFPASNCTTKLKAEPSASSSRSRSVNFFEFFLFFTRFLPLSSKCLHFFIFVFRLFLLGFLLYYISRFLMDVTEIFFQRFLPTDFRFRFLVLNSIFGSNFRYVCR